MTEHLMTNPTEVRTFALAGNARLTLVSKATQARFSYRVKASDDGAVHFVSVLTSPDNETGYSYLGIIGKDGAFRRTAKSKIAEGAPSAKAFDWFWRRVEAGKLHDDLEVWHEGRCGRCGRALTVPASIANGIGPECAKYVLGAAPTFPFEAGEPAKPDKPDIPNVRFIEAAPAASAKPSLIELAAAFAAAVHTDTGE